MFGGGEGGGRGGRKRVLRREQWGFLVLGLLPGVLALVGVMALQQAVLLVVFAYAMSRIHSFRLQKQFEAEEREREKAEEERRRKEEEEFAALPAKKRRNILKALAKRQSVGEGENAGDDDEGEKDDE